ncbi:hypothetical protein CBR_g30126 [Chara braunii]|uniref:Tafazzin family protein n=1 Tax=Chara braunii TaxID=69332 RepID=A0A388LC28_CHABU|nr:hypothetical protein CBR_g30126 [Chara braunii]|eukprot:GBG79861.1 hypothetical protein CBR_g30126 [Chara braunii]
MAGGGNYGSVPPAVAAAATWRLEALPRRIVLGAVGTFALLGTSVLNKNRVVNKKTLLDLIYNRPAGKPLLTCSNHMSTLDDPLMWGLKGVAFCSPEKMRWTQAADDICFTNPLYSYFFRLGKCIPIRRGAGILQPGMQETLEKLDVGDWVHVFPEGKVKQNDDLVLPRLKWGIGRLISQADTAPIVLPIAHSGFEKVLTPLMSRLSGNGEKAFRGATPLLRHGAHRGGGVARTRVTVSHDVEDFARVQSPPGTPRGQAVPEKGGAAKVAVQGSGQDAHRQDPIASQGGAVAGSSRPTAVAAAVESRGEGDDDEPLMNRQRRGNARDGIEAATKLWVDDMRFWNEMEGNGLFKVIQEARLHLLAIARESPPP